MIGKIFYGNQGPNLGGIQGNEDMFGMDFNDLPVNDITNLNSTDIGNWFPRGCGLSNAGYDATLFSV